MWKSEDSCTFFECIETAKGVKPSSYKKFCPPIDRNCAKSKIIVKDCCEYCEDDSNTAKSSQSI